MDGPNRQYLSAIRVAVRTLQRPTAVILRDHFAGHRNYFTGEPENAPYPTEWDYALIDVFQMVEDYQESDTGRFPWETQDPNLRWQGYTEHNSYLAATQEYEKSHQDKDGKSKIPDGDRILARIDWNISNAARPQKPSEWFAKQSEEAAVQEKLRLNLEAELARPENAT